MLQQSVSFLQQVSPSCLKVGRLNCRPQKNGSDAKERHGRRKVAKPLLQTMDQLPLQIRGGHNIRLRRSQDKHLQLAVGMLVLLLRVFLLLLLLLTWVLLLP